MRPGLSESDRTVLDCLHRLVKASVPELSESLGVTPSAVRQKLARMEAAGLVSKETIREGRGRPHHEFRLTDNGLDSLGGNYRELALLLWREVTAIEDEAIRSRILDRLREAMVHELGRAVTAQSMPERMRQLSTALEARGVDVDVHGFGEGGTLPILTEYNCPFHAVASEDSSICDLEQAVFAEILGTDVELTSCCQKEGSCCEFTVTGSFGS
ncbi:MAG: MarR family transcriptional regulator [Planctomycetota bacterium]|nr:MAG: MarR family transcriptional regulator [Planctomycetota bacterium]REK24443.1 MAG: MarR family transcriptional regulator [Planctomycetota bacterium]REK38632.1 MAG: MarR family transcriptional regulator [Planctomycetota bacterium]